MVEVVFGLIAGLAIVIYGADRFIVGAASSAGYLGMSPLLVGMIIIGFGTSSPEVAVSTFAALEGKAAIALGNAYGSNITNIALILGLSALYKSIEMNSRVLHIELPILVAVLAIGGWQIWDGEVSKADAWSLLVLFVLIMGWSVWISKKRTNSVLGAEVEDSGAIKMISARLAFGWLILGLILLIAGSKLFLWAAIDIAHYFGVSELIVGLTVVAVGTSLPELATSVVAMIRKQHDLAIGNIIGSNLFNSLVVIGVAGAINPIKVPAELFNRDFVLLAGLTIGLFVLAYCNRGPTRINRLGGFLLVSIYFGYIIWLVRGC